MERREWPSGALNIAGGEPRPLAAEGLRGGLISPDGKLMTTIDRHGEAGQVRLTPDVKYYVYTYWMFPSDLIWPRD
jgi:hypothetical protein